MTPLRSLIAKGGTTHLPASDLLAERPTLRELREQAFAAIRRGDYRRAVVYQQCIYGRLDEARAGEGITA